MRVEVRYWAFGLGRAAYGNLMWGTSIVEKGRTAPASRHGVSTEEKRPSKCRVDRFPLRSTSSLPYPIINNRSSKHSLSFKYYKQHLILVECRHSIRDIKKKDIHPQTPSIPYPNSQIFYPQQHITISRPASSPSPHSHDVWNQYIVFWNSYSRSPALPAYPH